MSINSIKKFLKKKKPSIIIHAAGLSRPMKLHDTNLNESIDKNIIGTANVVKVCSDLNIKIIYFSTVLVYCGNKGNYKETSPLLPVNNYAWSKLGGEACVHMYKNSLILRIGMSELPFVHKQAFDDVVVNYLYHDAFAKILPKILNCTGIINIGSNKVQTVYEFAKKTKSNVVKISSTKLKLSYPLKPYVSINKLKNILKKNKN
jgi:dTDP-4-dehydrorhamnose reductase